MKNQIIKEQEKTIRMQKMLVLNLNNIKYVKYIQL